MEKDFKTANELQTAEKEHIEKFGVCQQDLDDEKLTSIVEKKIEKLIS